MVERIPVEVWERILGHCDLASFSRLSRSCRRIQAASECEELWRRRFAATHRLAYGLLGGRRSGWRGRLRRRRVDAPAAVREALEALSAEYFYHADRSPVPPHAMESLLSTALGEEDALPLLWDAARTIALPTPTPRSSSAPSPFPPPGHNLTHGYYATHLLQFLNTRMLHHRIREHKDSVFYGAVLIAQWFQPHLFLDIPDLEAHVCSMANEIKAEMEKRGVDGARSRMRRDYQVLDILQHYWRDVFNFTGNSEDYYAPANSFIDKVLETKKGIPISLSILFARIAEELGLRLHFLNSPTHLLLRYSSEEEGSEALFVDAFNGGRVMRRAEVREMLGLDLGSWDPDEDPMPPLKVLKRVAANLEQIVGRHGWAELGEWMPENVAMLSASSLLLLLTQLGEESPLTLKAAGLRHLQTLANLSIFSEALKQQVLEELPQAQRDYLIAYEDMEAISVQKEKDKAAKLRSAEDNAGVEFQVGYVMRHRKFGYQCVIRGWDPVCGQSQAWQTQMGVEKLPNGPAQPFYNVLVDDGSDRYAAQENLERAVDSGPCRHPEIGRYFSAFLLTPGSPHTRYLPNAQLAQAYPQDA